MQIHTDILQIIPLSTAPLRGAAAAANPKGWAAGGEQKGTKLEASFMTKCQEHLFSNLCHKISYWEWKLLCGHFLPTSDQLSHATTWQNWVLHWKYLDWTKHQAMCLSWIGTCLGRSSLLLNKNSISGILFRTMEKPVSSHIRSDIYTGWPWAWALLFDSLLTKWIVCCCCYAICSNQGLFPTMSSLMSRVVSLTLGVSKLTFWGHFICFRTTVISRP